MRKCADADATEPRADRTPLPAEHSRLTDPRHVDVWCAFLGRLATDAEAALAAALAYRELEGAGREVWIDSLEQDMDRIAVPKIAVYAPLLAVEVDPKRRQRLLAAMGAVPPDAKPRATACALAGGAGGPARVTAIIAPLYLDFVQVLACSYRLGEAFDWVKHDPIVDRTRAPQVGDLLNGIVLEAVPLKAAVDDLAITVVAQTRAGPALPEALSVFADLFGPGGEARSPISAAM